jgi:RimJ/RimL family protein N-acetyltransferase
MEPPRYPTLIELPDELRSARIVVRPYRADDAEAVYAAIDESRDRLSPWLPWVHRHQSPDDSRDFCIRSAANWLARTTLEVGIFDARDGRFLGASGFPRLDWRARIFETGYWLRRSAEGHGYVSEAVQLLARLAFERLSANRLEIRCDARNNRSRAVPSASASPWRRGCATIRSTSTGCRATRSSSRSSPRTTRASGRVGGPTVRPTPPRSRSCSRSCRA